MIRQLAGVRVSQRALALRDKLALARSEALMERKKNLEKSRRKIPFQVNACRSGVDFKTTHFFHAEENFSRLRRYRRLCGTSINRWCREEGSNPTRGNLGKNEQISCAENC